MGFDMLLGNERLKENLTVSIGRGRISHFYLISGAAGSGRHTLARLLAAAILCRGTEKPCMHCSVCRRVMEDRHPDFITVDDAEKKTVPVDLIRRARADIFVQPNESEYKIYLFPRAQDMGIPGQNALLKVLEEPPKYGVFILLTDNPEKLLPTVRSRCTELALTALTRDVLLAALRREFPDAAHDDLVAVVQRSGGYFGQAKQLLADGQALPPQTEQLVQAWAARDAMALLQVLVPMERMKRDQLAEFLDAWVELMQAALICQSGLPAASPLVRKLAGVRTARDLMAALESLQRARDYTKGNVSPAAVCGYLEWTLR